MALPELLVIDHKGSWGPHTFTFQGTAETRGPGYPLPLATVSLSGSAQLGDVPGSTNTQCVGTANIIYLLDVVHVSGGEARSVPLRFRSRGAASASASWEDFGEYGEWTARGEAWVQRSISIDGGAPSTIIEVVCQGEVISPCDAPETSVSLDASDELSIDVPAGIGATTSVEFKIWAGVKVQIEAMKYPEYYGGQDYTGEGSGSAWIDPQIWIDPEWEYADEYGLEASPGISLPESGLGLLGVTSAITLAAMRRSRG